MCFPCLIFEYPEIKYHQKFRNPKSAKLDTNEIFKNLRIAKLNTRDISKNP